MLVSKYVAFLSVSSGLRNLERVWVFQSNCGRNISGKNILLHLTFTTSDVIWRRLELRWKISVLVGFTSHNFYAVVSSCKLKLE